SELARKVAEQLKGSPPSPSAQTLLLALKTPNALTLGPPPRDGNVSDPTRTAYAGLWLLEDKPGDALALAQRADRPDEKLRSLVLCADWAADPAPALDAALALLSAHSSKKKEVNFSPYAVMRLSQIAAAAGKAEQAKEFAKFLSDEGAQAWAKGD